MPRPQRLLLVGSGECFGSLSGNNIGECRFTVGNNLAQLGLRRFGESTNNSVPFNFAMNSVTGPVDQPPLTRSRSRSISRCWRAFSLRWRSTWATSRSTVSASDAAEADLEGATPSLPLELTTTR